MEYVTPKWKKADIVLIIQHISPLEGFIVLLIYYFKIVYN